MLIVISGTMCKHFRYRTLFVSFQVIQALISSLDLLLVCVAKDAFWGHFVALSDRAGTLGIQKVRRAPDSRPTGMGTARGPPFRQRAR